MIEAFPEILRAAAVFLIVVLLLRARRSVTVAKVGGWAWIVSGFVLLFCDTLLDITDTFPGLGRFLPVGSPADLFFWKEHVCSLGGFLFLAFGLFRWLPVVVQTREQETELRAARKQLRQRENELVHALEMAEAAREAKSTFLARMDHHLRTPVSSIYGFSKILRGVDLDPDSQHLVDSIRFSSEDLLEVLDNILECASLRAGLVPLKPDNFPVRKIVGQALVRMSAKAKEKGVTLESRFDGDVPDDLHGDPVQLARILGRLIDNGVKYTGSGGKVLVHVAADVVDRAGALLHFRVRDTGCGVPRELREQIFEPFSRVDDGVEQIEPGGVGLGLPVARQLARVMGGDLWLESGEEGQNFGSIFHFTVRLAWTVPMGHSAISTADIFRSAGSKILLAEDDPLQRKLTHRMLQWEDWRVTSVENGQQVLDAWSRDKFNLILMDIEMPEMDGLAAAAAIRAAEKEHGGHIKIIALTAYAMEEDRKRCQEAGMDDFLSKPYRGEDLLNLIEKHLHDDFLARRAKEPQ